MPTGIDAADNEIVAQMAPGDLVVTQDIPLAAEVVAGGGEAISPRGVPYTEESVRQHLARRNLMEELRASGLVSGGPPALGQTEVRAFANALDRFLARHRKTS